MPPPNILIVDNDELFAEGCAEFLESAGYRVRTVSDLESAGRALAAGDVHLAILDLRLVNDLDEQDVSGLSLARSSDPSVPKIILTSYQRWEDVRAALGPTDSSQPAAVSFVAKQEGLDVLLSHVRRVLEFFAAHNWRLEIEWRARDRVSLLGLIGPDLEPAELAARADELEDLFRLLFQRQAHVRVERLLWDFGRRIALSCFVFEEGRRPETYLVVCGPKREVSEEAQLFDEFAPKAAGSPATLLEESRATTHYAANRYTLLGAHLEDLRRLEDLYREGPEKSFQLAVRNLFTQTLASWSQGRFAVGRRTPLRLIFNRQLGIRPKQPTYAISGERLRELIEHLSAVGIDVTKLGGRLSFDLPGGLYSYADPSRPLSGAANVGHDALLVNVPGELSGRSILVDKGERTWVTDFAQAGLAPLFWSLAELEAVVRFDWVDVSRLEWLHQMERQLVFGDFIKLQPTEVEPSLRKPMRAIQAIRQLTKKPEGRDTRSYHLAILLYAAKRLKALRLGPNLLPPELSGPAHLLLAAAMIYERLEAKTDVTASGIRLDKSKGEVWVDGRRLLLRGHSYKLLCNFYDHPNQLRTRQQLVEEVFGERYDETDFSQISRLNTAIHRLRKQLEADPENPRYLLTEQRGGYRLVLEQGSQTDRGT